MGKDQSEDDALLLGYEAVPWADNPTWQRAGAGFSALLNGIVATSCVIIALKLGPKFGDTTSRNGVILPLVFWKFPLLLAGSVYLAVCAKRADRILGRVACAFSWAVFAVWTTIIFLLFFA